MTKIKVNLLIAFSIMLILIIYTAVDNNGIKIVGQEVAINHLPQGLDGFTILQISDLHEKEFGRDQARLIKKINSLSYDAIVFTGDMLKSNGSMNYKPFFNLLEGIDNKENAFFVLGNTDPNGFENSYEKTDFLVGMERRGVMPLESYFTVTKNNAKIHFVNFDFSILNPEDSYEIGGSDVLIGLTHYPVVDKKLDYYFSDSTYTVRDFDLLIAGHYHGGQIRIPFLGALFIPEGWYPRDGLFPPQDRVKGLWEYRGIKQYVSTGLGSSDAISVLDFRLFNTPEINVLTLRDSK